MRENTFQKKNLPRNARKHCLLIVPFDAAAIGVNQKKAKSEVNQRVDGRNQSEDVWLA